jgi:hypothetical protein
MVALAKATHGRALEGRLGAADFAFAAPRQIEAAESPRGLTLESALLAAALALFAAAHALRERVP